MTLNVAPSGEITGLASRMDVTLGQISPAEFELTSNRLSNVSVDLGEAQCPHDAP